MKWVYKAFIAVFTFIGFVAAGAGLLGLALHPMQTDERLLACGALLFVGAPIAWWGWRKL